MPTGMWATGDPSVFDIAAPQKALAAALEQVIGDPARTARAMEVIGHHVHVHASERMLSTQWQGYGQTCLDVAHQMNLKTGTDPDTATHPITHAHDGSPPTSAHKTRSKAVEMIKNSQMTGYESTEEQ